MITRNYHFLNKPFGNLFEGILRSNYQDSYKTMAWYYRELIQSTGRLDNEIRLVLSLLKRIGIHKQSRILDFACGTGDVLAGLKTSGWENLFGLDGSQKMINRAQELDTNVAFTCCQWSRLKGFFINHTPFDFAFALSISLPHIGKNELNAVLSELRKGIRKGGWICFDFRHWVRSFSGRLIEPNRPEGVFQWCGAFQIKDDYFWVDDQCSYDVSRQYVHYRIRKRNKDGFGYCNEQKLTVSYALLDTDEYITAVRNAGFDEIEVAKPLKWPYLVLTARAN